MYIDSKKFDYSKFEGVDVSSLIQRDKEFSKSAYRKWIEDSVEDIVEREWEVDDIGAVEQSGEFTNLLREAEFTYAIGAFTSTIALVGVCAEDLCRFFATSAGHSFDQLSQFKRVDRLLSIGAITQDIADRFHRIRGLRNDCLHFNQGFKQKVQADLRLDALNALNDLKSIYGAILGVIDYQSVGPSKILDIVEKIAKQSTDTNVGNLGFGDVVAKLRNVFSEAFGFDLSMNNSNSEVLRTSIFEVLEIDEDIEPYELSLKDLRNGMSVIVDVTKEEIKYLEGSQVGDVIGASLVSKPNELGMTGTWHLHGNPTKIG